MTTLMQEPKIEIAPEFQSMKIEQTSIESTIRHHLPNFHIHSGEKYHSMFITDYMKYCSESSDRLHLTVTCDECKYGNKTQLQILSNMIELMDDNNQAVVDIVYYVFYPYNGGLGPFQSGKHWYDMEHVTLRFKGTIQSICNNLYNIPYKVLFSIHSKYRWFDWTSFDIDVKNGKLNVYVAKHSHACYPKPKTYIRYFGWANDCCDLGCIPAEIKLRSRSCSNTFGGNTNVVNLIIYDSRNPIFQYKSVADGDEGRNWNRKELLWGESPVYSSYNKSITCYMFT